MKILFKSRATILTYLRFLNYKLKSDHPGVCACVCQYFSVTVCEGQRDTSCNLSGHAQLFKFFFVALSALLLLSISIRRIPLGREITVVMFPPFNTYLLVHYLGFFLFSFSFLLHAHRVFFSGFSAAVFTSRWTLFYDIYYNSFVYGSFSIRISISW